MSQKMEPEVEESPPPLLLAVTLLGSPDPESEPPPEPDPEPDEGDDDNSCGSTATTMPDRIMMTPITGCKQRARWGVGGKE